MHSLFIIYSDDCNIVLSFWFWIVGIWLRPKKHKFALLRLRVDKLSFFKATGNIIKIAIKTILKTIK